MYVNKKQSANQTAEMNLIANSSWTKTIIRIDGTSKVRDGVPDGNKHFKYSFDDGRTADDGRQYEEVGDWFQQNPQSVKRLF